MASLVGPSHGASSTWKLRPPCPPLLRVDVEILLVAGLLRQNENKNNFWTASQSLQQS